MRPVVRADGGKIGARFLRPTGGGGGEADKVGVGRIAGVGYNLAKNVGVGGYVGKTVVAEGRR